MSPLLRKPFRTALGVAIASVTLAGCVHPKQPSVGISPLNADIVFGVKKLEETTPANFTPSDPSASGIAAADDANDLLPPEVLGATKRSFPRPAFENTSPAVNDCPPAAQNAFPAETAPTNVPSIDRKPKEGVYRWKKSGTVTYSTGVSTVDGFEERAIQNIKDDPDPADATNIRYTYDVVQPDVASNVITVSSFHVQTKSRGASSEPGLGVRVRQGEPERGLVLRAVQRFDDKGNKVGTPFRPATGLLLFPLGVSTGEKFTSVAVDPTTQVSYQFDGQLIDRDRIDACGEIFEGWRVEGTLAISGAGTQKYNFIVAPQFGAVMLAEHREGMGVNVDFSAATNTPKPLPTVGE